MEIYKKIKLTFPNLALLSLAFELEDSLSDCNTVLDVGCGSNSPLRLVGKRDRMVGIDGYKPAITESKKQNIHTEYLLNDIKNIKKLFKNKSFDAVIALDVIEHLDKDEGHRLIQDMEKIAKKKVVILTPNGFVPQEDPNNKLQLHLSGWTTTDMAKNGFKVLGMYGLKNLRGNEAGLKLKPKILWGIISEVSHYIYTKYHPRYAFSLFCVKTIKGKY